MAGERGIGVGMVGVMCCWGGARAMREGTRSRLMWKLSTSACSLQLCWTWETILRCVMVLALLTVMVGCGRESCCS